MSEAPNRANSLIKVWHYSCNDKDSLRQPYILTSKSIKLFLIEFISRESIKLNLRFTVDDCSASVSAIHGRSKREKSMYLELQNQVIKLTEICLKC